MPAEILTRGNPNSPGTASGGAPNGDGAIPKTGALDRSVLSNLLKQTATNTESTDNAALQTAPSGEAGATEELTTTDEHGQSTTSERTDDGAQATADGTDSTATTDEGAEGAQAAALAPEVQEHVNNLAQLLADGKLSIGEVKRIEKLLRGKGTAEETIAQLQSQVAELQQRIEQGSPAPEASTAGSQGSNPLAAVVKDEASARQMTRTLHDILDWCEDNESGGVYKGTEYDQNGVRDLRRESRRALDVYLPERRAELAQQATVAQGRAQTQAWVKANAPWVYDRENPDGRRAAEYLNDPAIKSRANGDVIAAMLVLGEKELRKQMALKAQPKRNGAPASKPTNGTPAGKPPAPGGGGAARAGTPSALKAATERVMTERSRSSLAGLLKVAQAPPAAAPARK